jgi:hypothetical protein
LKKKYDFVEAPTLKMRKCYPLKKLGKSLDLRGDKYLSSPPPFPTSIEANKSVDNKVKWRKKKLQIMEVIPVMGIEK